MSVELAKAPSGPPRWARLLDYLFLALVGVAIIVAISGGFRVRIGPVPVALRSAERLMLWAALVAVVRHVFSPRAPIYRDVPARFRSYWQAPHARAAFSAWIGTRPVILFVGYLAIFLFGYPGRVPWRASENEFANLQARFDAGWYLSIAANGYEYLPERPDRQQNIVFFPAMPLLMRVAGRLLGGASTAYLAGGTIVSLMAFFIALGYLFRFARDTLCDGDQAAAAVWLLAAYPFALFYGAVYTESLFLLGTVATFWHARRHEWWKAAGWALLVGFTRPNGFFLGLPLGVLALSPWLPHWIAGGSRAPAEVESRGRLAPFLLACVPGVGVLVQSAYVWGVTGNPLMWAAGQVAWGRDYEGLAVITEGYGFLSQVGLYEYTTHRSTDILQALGAALVLVAAWPVARRLGLAYALFILINILPQIAMGGWLSVGRFSAVLFPAFVWLGSVVPAGHRSAWLTSFMAVQAFSAALFYTWRSIY
jgi:hypothetical protein